MNFNITARTKQFERRDLHSCLVDKIFLIFQGVMNSIHIEVNPEHLKGCRTDGVGWAISTSILTRK